MSDQQVQSKGEKGRQHEDRIDSASPSQRLSAPPKNSLHFFFGRGGGWLREPHLGEIAPAATGFIGLIPSIMLFFLTEYYSKRVTEAAFTPKVPGTTFQGTKVPSAHLSAFPPQSKDLRR